MKTSRLATVSIVVIGFATTWTSPAAAAQATRDTSSGPIEEIIVTAQKRSERLIDVPATVTVVSSDQLELAGTNSLESLSKLVPGVHVTTGNYGLSPTVRGITSTLSISNESNVVTYIDGVYQPTKSSNIFDLSSVSSVEVLKGPQGTLFGRNATGGAILVETLDPSVADVEGNFKLGYGRFDEREANAYLNVPLGDRAAVNGAVAYSESDGYIRDVRSNGLVNNWDRLTMRGKLLFRPLDSLEVILTTSQAEMDDPTFMGTYQALESLYGRIPASQPLAEGRFELSHDVPPVMETEAREHSARITLDTSAGTLTSITALQDDRILSTNDIDATYLPAFRVDFQYSTEAFSQEINFASPSNRPLSYVIGAYYFDYETQYDFFQYNLVDFLFSNSTNHALAAYADGTYRFGDFGLTLGLRYSTEEREMSNGLLVPVEVSRVIEETDSSWTPRIALTYAISNRANVYASYSRGFKSGAFNSTSLSGEGVEPETVDAYEIGFKSSGDRYRLSTAAFYYSYDEVQATTIDIRTGVAVATLTNASKARIYGFEVGGHLRVSERLGIRAGFAFTDGEYTSFPDAPAYQPLPGGGYQVTSTDASGNPMVLSPEYTFTSSFEYRLPLGGSELLFSVLPSYRSKVYFDFASTQSQDDVFLLDAQATLDIRDGWRVTAFGRNLTDNVYYDGLGYTNTNLNALYGTPRTYGLSVAFDY